MQFPVFKRVSIFTVVITVVNVTLVNVHSASALSFSKSSSALSINTSPTVVSSSFGVSTPGISISGGTTDLVGKMLRIQSDSPVTFTFALPLAYFGMSLASDIPHPKSVDFSVVGANLTSPTSHSFNAPPFETLMSGTYLNVFSSTPGEEITQITITSLVSLSINRYAYEQIPQQIPQQIPSPAMLPGLIGMGVAAMRRRYQIRETNETKT